MAWTMKLSSSSMTSLAHLISFRTTQTVQFHRRFASIPASPSLSSLFSRAESFHQFPSTAIRGRRRKRRQVSTVFERFSVPESRLTRIWNERIVGAAGNSDKDSNSMQVPFSISTKRVLEAAVEYSRSRGYNFIAPEHIALGLFSVDDGSAARVLQRTCLQCGIPKTFTNAQGMVCPVCGDRPAVEPSSETKKKGSAVKNASGQWQKCEQH